MTNRLTRAHLAGLKGIRLRESIRIECPVEDVFDFWRDLPNLPRFMSYVEQIDLRGDGLSHWVVRGPGGVTLEWDARIIKEQRPHMIAWESIGSPDVVSMGSVKFTPLGADETDVDVVLQYDAPGDKVSAGMASLVGLSPATALRDDLRRLKQLLESGRWRSGVDVAELWLTEK